MNSIRNHPRIKLLEERGILRVEITPKRHWLLIGVMLLWIAVWATIEWHALQWLMEAMNTESETASSQPFLWIWVMILTSFGWRPVRLMIYIFFGKEIITFNEKHLILDKKNGLILRPKTFKIAEIRKLEVNTSLRPKPYKRADNYRMALGKAGKIRFLYQHKMYFMASGVSEEEAAELLALLREHGIIKNLV